MSAKPVPIQKARDRVKRVFQYLRELHHIKTPPVSELSRYEWIFWLDSLPLYPSIVRGADFQKLQLLGLPSASDNNGDFIIKVSRPKESECPEPGVMLKNWLKPGYAKVGAVPNDFLRDSFKPKGGKKENFNDITERVEAFDDWLNQKRQWEVSEKKVLDALGAFEDLFDLYGRISRESEKFQLYAADGILVTKKDGVTVKHPLLLQRISLDFNAAGPQFTLKDSGDPPEIYNNLLRYMGIDSNLLKKIREQLKEEHQHPFGGLETTEFLKGMIQSLWSDGQFFNSEIEAKNSGATTYVYRKPHVFLGLRNFGFAETIDRYIESIPKKEEFPESLLRLVGIDTGAGEERDASERSKSDLLLTKPANPEQERVLHRLEETGAVLVQGPPGTGKSHTIANLIGHLLAQKKSILVTSHTSKALRVVRQHVSEPLQALCVSVLQDDEDNNKQLEESVTGILNYISTNSEKKLQQKLEKLETKRKELKENYAQTREKLLTAAEEEYRSIQTGEQKMLPSQAARWLEENAETNGWISGPIPQGAELPLSNEEVQQLYELNHKISAEDEKYLQSQLPDEAKLPTAEMFAKHFDLVSGFAKDEIGTGSEYWLNDDQNEKQIRQFIVDADQAAKVFDDNKLWVNEFLEIGRLPEKQKRPWLDLFQHIHDSNEVVPEKESLILSHGPSIDSQSSDEENIKICREIIKYLENGKKLKSFSKLLHRSWARFLEEAKVDGKPPSKVEHFDALEALMELKTVRENLTERWNRVRELLDEDPLEGESLGRKPEKKLLKFSKRAETAMNWYEEKWGKNRENLKAAGFDWDKFLQKAQSQKSGDDQGALRFAIRSLLIPLLEARVEFSKWKDIEKKSRSLG